MTSDIRIALNLGRGTSCVVVDGVDLSGAVTGIAISRDASDADSLVHLTLRANVEIEGEVGQVVAIQPGLAPEAAMLQMLEGVDAGELEAEAMSKLGGLVEGPETPTEAILLVLREWVAQGG